MLHPRRNAECSNFVLRIMPSKNTKNKQRRNQKQNGRRKQSGRRGNVPQVVTGQAMVRSLSQPPRQTTVVCHKWGTDTRILQTTSDSFGATDFRLTNTDASTLSQYFEEYMISKVECFFRPMYRQSSYDSLAYAPIIYVRPDPIDSSTWTSVADARASDGVITMDDTAGFCVKFSPRVNSYVYSGSVNNSGAPGPVWLSTGDNSVRHYGLKWAVTGGGASATEFQEWNFSFRMEVRMRIAKRTGGTLSTVMPLNIVTSVATPLESPSSPFEEVKESSSPPFVSLG